MFNHPVHANINWNKCGLRISLIKSNMKIATLLLGLVYLQFAAGQGCNSGNCQLPDCRCMSTSTPGNLPLNQTPQFVFLTFEDAITVANYGNYTAILKDRKNPNGCSISMTFYVNHRNNDYVYSHSLYWAGNELASKTVSDTDKSTDIWAETATPTWTDEVNGMRTILERFANVPKLDVQGSRAPNLQTNGDAYINALYDINMLYDNSYSTVFNSTPPVWPYTLDYGFQHECQDARGKCPRGQYPGMWLVPMTVLYNQGGYCAMADACPKPLNQAQTFDYLKSNFDRHYTTTKAPLGIYLHSAWFQANPYTLNAYLDFLNYLGGLNDVFIVSVTKGLRWMQNPVSLSQIMAGGSPALSCPSRTPSTCIGRPCSYIDPDTGLDVLMRSCTQCPPNYPSVDNPLGL